MSWLIFVRHSLPQIDPNTPAVQWPLSDEGRQQCVGLAEQLRAYRPEIIVTSVEPKAQETGRIIGEQLVVAVETAANLHEHERGNVGWVASRAAFEAQVARFFNEPGELLFGLETADEAYGRFAGAVEAVVAGYPQQNVVIVTHGTVLSLFVGRTAGVDGYSFWQRLGMPAYVVMTLPDYEVVVV